MKFVEGLKKKIEKERMTDTSIYWPLVVVKDLTRAIKNCMNTKYKTRLMENHKTIFFYIHKNGTTSLRSIFKGKEDQVTRINLDTFKDYFKFAFVRNPYDRIVSCYLYSCKTNKQKNRRKLTRKKNGKIKRREFLNFNAMFYPGISFKEFAKCVCKMPDSRISDEHFRSQYLSLIDKNGKLIPNFIGKIENLKEDYKKVWEIIGIKNPPELSHKNKSKNRKDYREYYDEETRKMVSKRYSKDLKLFKYKF